MRVTLLDYGAGNVRSIRNALNRFGVEVVDVRGPADVLGAEVLVFPGVGAFGAAMGELQKKGLTCPLKEYLRDTSRPYLGICIGMQVLFEGSTESPGAPGLGVLEGAVESFTPCREFPVPHIGWNGAAAPVGPGGARRDSRLIDYEVSYYFVHSYRAARSEWASAATAYGSQVFASAVERGAQCAVQFHPEKSGAAGLKFFEKFLKATRLSSPSKAPANWWTTSYNTRLARRVVCALDVRSNDAGDLVVTKGDGYDVRETTETGRPVRNLGKPVQLCGRYYSEGADEIAILNICAFRSEPIRDLPLLGVLERASVECFVPLTIGGGVRAYVDADGRKVEALEVAAAYFRAGADKISIGSDAVHAAIDLRDRPTQRAESSIEQIAKVYGAQAVVVSIDPKRVELAPREQPPAHATPLHFADGRRAWYQCTVSGGRTAVDLDAVALAKAAQALGAGELMVNCIDCDGKKAGFDLVLLKAIKQNVSIPVIASSGAGHPDHFVQAFAHAHVDAALAAGIFHRREVAICEVKHAIVQAGLPARTF